MGLKKIGVIVFIVCVSIATSYAQMFELSSRDASKLAGRKLIIILQEETPEKLKQFRKSPEKTTYYKNLVAYTNTTLINAANNFWNSNIPFEFKTREECLAISDTSEAYITLDFASLNNNSNVQLYHLRPDTASPYALRLELFNRREFGFFELNFIEKIKGSSFYVFHTPSSFPNNLDFATAFQFISTLLDESIKDNKFSTRDFEAKIKDQNKILASKTLVADSNQVNRIGKNYDYIRRDYDSASTYFIADAPSIESLLFKKDTNQAYFTIVPYVDPITRGQSYIGSSGGSLNDVDKTVYYMQLVLECATGKVLYYDKTEDRVLLSRDWKRFQRFSKDNTFFELPLFNETPVEEKNNPQNQY